MQNVPYIRMNGGRAEVIKRDAITHIRGQALPADHETYTGILESLDNTIRPRGVGQGALSNAHGDWYEWMLALEAWNTAANNPDADLALLLPNKRRFDLSRLYSPRICGIITDLRNKVLQTGNISFVSSNPDFVILGRSVVDRVIPHLNPINMLSNDAIDTLDNSYLEFADQCSFEEIKGYISVKSSLRPDRRLQIPHEGSLMKAVYVHIQTREWIINPNGIKYYAISTAINDSDIEALNTVATHSITTVSSVPQAAVDQLFAANSPVEARAVFEQILLP
ncbi:Cfr10I/Bse634I family restriction endonuclease [Xinfangfangia sp. D13-10-4-6]|uniref:Cfr10I/Bse634I family restriction endonuclease n=1 Tax=Pseudogemmobacter hezensis TaxID=2737662 RepID=UPI001556548C|nr:Cfr10I/Bse634I family restriction endonuclease [Pseudogemmobacter hezensis]NPD17309.1 Cfr10I/Bse634I family restriction endonuclease [Pseudogemmobacter hezensis]